MTDNVYLRMVNHAAPVAEIFDSIQGEGKYIGARQIFVRLSGCPLDCPYCDTDHRAGSKFVLNGREFDNPAGAEELARLLEYAFALEEYHSVSFTGGEPLIYPDFLNVMAKFLRAKLFLETSGHDPQALLNVADCFDYISVDLKGTITPFDEHADRLLSAVGLISPSKIYVKMPLSADGGALVEIAAPLFSKYAVNEVWLQPIDNKYDIEAVGIWQRHFARHGVDARFVPQIHKLMGIP